MVFIVYVWFWGIQNCCKYLYGKRNTLPNGINSDFKKSKLWHAVFGILWLYFGILDEPYTMLTVQNFLKRKGFAINLKSGMEEWEEHGF